MTRAAPKPKASSLVKSMLVRSVQATPISEAGQRIMASVVADMRIEVGDEIARAIALAAELGIREGKRGWFKLREGNDGD